MRRVTFVYYGMMVSFTVKPGDLNLFLKIIKENGATCIEVVQDV